MDSPFFPLAGAFFSIEREPKPSAARVVHPLEAWRRLRNGGVSGGVHERLVSKLTLASMENAPSCLCDREVRVLEGLLVGEAQKLIADATGISVSHVSFVLGRALAKLGLESRTVPLAIVALAQCHAGLASPEIVNAVFDATGTQMVIAVGAPRPGGPLLTSAEKVVASLFVEGLSRGEIASLRASSYRTIACQLGSVFSKLNVSNRCEMALAFAQRGWMSSPQAPVALLEPAPADTPASAIVEVTSERAA